MWLQVVAMSRRGLEARGMGEDVFLAPLEEIARTGLSLADRLQQSFREDWGGSVDPVFSQEYFF